LPQLLQLRLFAFNGFFYITSALRAYSKMLYFYSLHLLRKISAYILLGLFFWPQVANALHSIVHKHEACNIEAAHIHKVEFKCKYTDYNYCAFDSANPPSFEVFTALVFSVPANSPYDGCLLNAYRQSKSRGPPVL
jgi:hypothetical protein